MLWRELMPAGMEAAPLSSPTARGQMETMLQQRVLVLWESLEWGTGGFGGEGRVEWGRDKPRLCRPGTPSGFGSENCARASREMCINITVPSLARSACPPPPQQCPQLLPQPQAGSQSPRVRDLPVPLQLP